MAIITSYPNDSLTTDADRILTVDSDGTTKLTPVSNLLGYGGTGWVPAQDTLSFSSYSNGVGIINTTAGATTRYGLGYQLKFNQPTLGTKYGTITAVAASTITVTFNTGSQLDNEAITLPFYSTAATPFGSGLIKPAQTGVTKTTDANGWTVYDYVAWKMYKKRVTFSQSIGTAAGLTLSSNLLPAGISSIGTNILTYSYTATGSAYALSIVFEGTSASTFINFTTARNDGAAAATFTGWIDLELTTP